MRCKRGVSVRPALAHVHPCPLSSRAHFPGHKKEPNGGTPSGYAVYSTINSTFFASSVNVMPKDSFKVV